MRELLGCLPMLLLLACAAAVDVRWRRIPNWVTAALVVTGLARVALLPDGTIGQVLSGMGAGFGLTFVLFAVGAMGGGDVKMFAGLGAWLGAGRVIEVFAAAAIAGMVIVVWQAARAGRLGGLARGSAVIVLNAATTGDLSAPDAGGELAGTAATAAGPKPLPYAVPTLVATLLVLISGRRWL